MKTLRWGVLSVSRHYKLRIHDEVSSSELNTVAGIASRDSARAAAEARDLGIPKSFGSYEALLEDPGIDAVYIPLPNHLHAPWIKKAAAAGKHVLCEKPFALSADEAAEAVAFARGRGVLVMEAFMYRFHPQWQAARRIIRSGEIGAPVLVQTRYAYTNKDPGNIRNNPEIGGGGFLDIGCYAVSGSRYLLGEEPRRVLSLVNRDPRLGVDALSSALLDFGTAHAQFTVSTQAFPSQKVEVVGTAGSLTLELPFNMFPDVKAELTVRTNIGTRTVRLGPAGQYRLMFDAFAEAVAAGALPGSEPTPPEDGIANMRVLDALFRSEKSGAWEVVAR